MAMKDIVFDGDGPATLTVYPGEPEEYRTLVSPEAVNHLRLTLELRERSGEKPTPESPVVRIEDGRPLQADWLSGILRRLKLKAGIITNSRDGGFKAAHGFRKFFKSNFPACPLHGDLEAEILMGHKRPYDKASWEHVKERYMVAVPFLTIDANRRDDSKWMEDHFENLEMREQVRELRRNQARILELLMAGAKVDPKLLGLKPEDVGNG
jgi:hypothetical protein